MKGQLALCCFKLLAFQRPVFAKMHLTFYFMIFVHSISSMSSLSLLSYCCAHIFDSLFDISTTHCLYPRVFGYTLCKSNDIKILDNSVISRVTFILFRPQVDSTFT